MRVPRVSLATTLLTLSVGVAVVGAQNPAGRGGGRGSGRGGRGRAIQVMTLTTTAWPDGGAIPTKYAQPGHEVSPPLSWTGAPDSTASFVLVVHDPNSATGNGTDDALHWLVWNIPGTARELPEGFPQGPEQPDRTRQISMTGPYYRAPAAPANGPPHHFVYELFALDTVVTVLPTDAPPAATRAAVTAAMAGHVRAKAVLVGLYKRSQ